jgi:Rrf2 family protein
MISRTSEYSLRAVVALARSPGVPRTTHEVAEVTRVPVGYLAKLLQNLARAGIVSSQRGLNGGFVLARDPAEVTLLDVVRVADGSMRIKTCPMGIPEHGARLCPLHQRLDDAAALAEQTLAGATLAELLADSAIDPANDCLDGRACGGCERQGSAPGVPPSRRIA